MATKAHSDYVASSATVSALLALEATYADPPNLGDQSSVEGLRGGSIVLMVAAFENWLKESFTESLSLINSTTPPCNYTKLPMVLQTEAVWAGLDYAMRGRPGGPRLERSQRLPDVLDAARRIHLGEVIADAVAKTSGNPNAAQVKTIYKMIDYQAPLTKIKPAFDSAWGTPTAKTFIPDTLDTIIGRRHVVAHTASILNTSRSDLATWKRFLDLVVGLLDSALERQVARIIKNAQ